MVVPDETKKKWVSVEYIYDPIIRNKYQTFWKYVKNDENIYIYLNKEVIKLIILDNGITCKELRETSDDPFIFTCKNDIIKLFSKSSRRSIYLD